MLLDIAFLLIVLILASRIIVILYKKGITTSWIVEGLLLGLLAYNYFFHEPNDSWSRMEGYAILGIFIAILVTVNPNISNDISDDSSGNNSDEELHSERHSNFYSWLSTFLLLSWLLGDDDDDGNLL